MIAKSENELDIEHYNADMQQSALIAEQNAVSAAEEGRS